MTRQQMPAVDIVRWRHENTQIIRYHNTSMHNAREKYFHFTSLLSD